SIAYRLSPYTSLSLSSVDSSGQILKSTAAGPPMPAGEVGVKARPAGATASSAITFQRPDPTRPGGATASAAAESTAGHEPDTAKDRKSTRLNSSHVSI